MTAGMIPSRTSVNPNTASGWAIAMSAQATRPEPPPSAIPVHDADHGRGARVDRLEHAVETQRILDVLVVVEVDGRALPLDVRACTEARALPAEHDGTRVADVPEGFGQLAR